MRGGPVAMFGVALGAMLGVVHGAAFGAAWPTPARAAHAADVRVPSELGALLSAHCIDCHDGARGKGGLDLAPTLASGVIAEEPLRALRRRLVKRDMPPADEPERPTRDGYAAAVAAIDAVVAPAAREVAAVRRLNRDQYLRSVRDVLGSEALDGLDPAALLPRDEIGEGFDTTADTLALPPLLIEKYFDAAESIAARAVPPPSLERRTRIDAAVLERAGAGHVAGEVAWLATRGTLAARFAARSAGRYRVTVDACGQQAGDAPPRMSVVVAGKEEGERDVAALREKPQPFVFECDLPAGEHRVVIAFLNDFWDPKNPDPARRDRNLGVLSVTVEGPLGATADTAFEQRIDDACGDGGVATRIMRAAALVGGELFRRPLAEDEARTLARRVRAAAGADAAFDAQLRALVTALLVDPRFLLRVERDDPLPAARRALDAHELAARLSFFLWSSVPDAALRARAADGSLARPEVLRAEARRMLADPRARALSERFATQWLGIDALEARELDRAIYPAADAALLSSMRRETELLFDDIVRDAKPVRALLEARSTHVDARLARHYGIDGVPAEGFHERPLPAARAAGVLGHGSVLVATSNPTRTSPVKRGKWVLEALLDAAPPPPPPGVPQLPETVEARRGLPMRELMRLHRENPDCASCHVRMDAIGLAFERADADGRARDTVDGAPVDDATELPDGSVLRGIDGVRVLVAADDAFERSLARHLMVYALGRGTADADDALLDAMARELRASGRFSTLVERLVGSEAFTTRANRTKPHGP
ncbi:MAG: DUF1592 domain-containing protein [Planctomycetota bacterium]